MFGVGVALLRDGFCLSLLYMSDMFPCRCLEPGKYAVHLERWLAHYPASRLVIVDGEQLRGDPVSVMAGLQHKLHLSPVHDYSRSLYFDKTLGFYCMKSEGQGKCLGKGKGRVYTLPPPRPRFRLWRRNSSWPTCAITCSPQTPSLHLQGACQTAMLVENKTTGQAQPDLQLPAEPEHLNNILSPDKYEYNLDR